jgi:nitrogenase-associated protein
MQTIEFFEKPGCSTNTTQVASLRAVGCTVATRSLLTHPWTAETLLAFLALHPSPAWFNRAAPKVKSGEIVPEDLSPDEALTALLAEPLLIRRPLIRIGNTHLLGFDPVAIAAAFGRPAEGFLGTPPGEGCSHKPGTPSCDSGGSP